MSVDTGQGYLFSAWDTEGGIRAVLKFLRKTTAIHLARFEREAKALQALVNQPNLVRYFAFDWPTDGDPWLAMEFIDGETLTEASRLDLPSTAIQQILEQVIRGLRILHAAKLVHRDIKPSNIMLRKVLDRSIDVCLIDLGLVRGHGDDPLTKDGLGTEGYMAPEQQCAGGRVEARTDVYALAVVTAELLTKRRRKHFDSWGSLLALVPSSFRPLLEWATRFEPEARPFLNEFETTLKAAFAGESIELAPRSITEPSSGELPETSQASNRRLPAPPAPPTPPVSPKTSWVPWILPLGSVLSAGFALALLYDRWATVSLVGEGTVVSAPGLHPDRPVVSARFASGTEQPLDASVRADVGTSALAVTHFKAPAPESEPPPPPVVRVEPPAPESEPPPRVKVSAPESKQLRRRVVGTSPPKRAVAPPSTEPVVVRVEMPRVPPECNKILLEMERHRRRSATCRRSAEEAMRRFKAAACGEHFQDYTRRFSCPEDQ